MDNKGTKFCLIRASSDNFVVDKLVFAFCAKEAVTHAVNWIARVPSYSNCADDPSRGEAGKLLATGFVDASAEAYFVIVAQLMASISDLGEKAETIRSPTEKVGHCLGTPAE